MFDPQLYRVGPKWKNGARAIPFRTSADGSRQITTATWRMKRASDDIDAEIDTAEACAKAGTWEPVEHLTRYVYAEKSH